MLIPQELQLSHFSQSEQKESRRCCAAAFVHNVKFS